jgi:DNA polymerase III gamma/tau subunit
MEKIMISENIIIENDAKEFILSVSNNSIRILINYLEKLKLIPFIINKSLAIQTCTNINFNDFEIYTNYCLTNKLNDAIKTIYTMYDQGYSVIDILDNYFQFIKTTNILEENIKYKIIKLLCKYITIFHNIHEDEIELSLFTNNLIDTLITATYHSN